METKKCSKCKVIKEINQFHKHKARKDGLTDACADCNIKRVSNYTERNKKRVSDSNKRRSRTTKGQFNELKRGAKRRNISVELCLDSFLTIRNNAVCNYCAGPLPETSSGLDRKDNAIGYTLTNVVPCCFSCNREKSDGISFYEYSLIWAIRKGKIPKPML